MADRVRAADELVDMRRAANLVSRHPETVRRWVWSGRLAAQRRGNRLLVARADLEALAGHVGAATSLREWASRARAVRSSARAAGAARSAADLVIEDRDLHSGRFASDARR